MTIFSTWINLKEETNGDKSLHICTEQTGGRARIADDLKEIMRSHYNDLTAMANDIGKLGYDMASAILKERLPQSKRGRSGDLGEILATEYVEKNLDYQVPIRRLKYKDGRDMALRGDDFIGIKYDQANGLRLLKGESKSAKVLSNATIKSARKALNRDHGRCTPHALLFVADRLLESSAAHQILGMALKVEVVKKSLSAKRIAHAIFTMTGNSPLTDLRSDLAMADTSRRHMSINLQISDHQDFIAESYLDLHDLGKS